MELLSIDESSIEDIQKVWFVINSLGTYIVL